MRVSLLEDVRALGPKGSTLDVPDGYAVNFLFPQHLAVNVGGSAVTDKEEVKMLRAVDTAGRPSVSPEQALASEIDGLEVVIKVQMKNGKFSAPVTATEVRAALKDMGYKLPKSAIYMKAITSLGSVDVPVAVDTEFEAKVTVVVEESA